MGPSLLLMLFQLIPLFEVHFLLQFALQFYLACSLSSSFAFIKICLFLRGLAHWFALLEGLYNCLDTIQYSVSYSLGNCGIINCLYFLLPAVLSRQYQLAFSDFVLGITRFIIVSENVVVLVIMSSSSV